MQSIQRINPRNLNTAQQIYQVQQAAYAVESRLIAYPDLPPLHETITDIQHSAETFLGCLVETSLIGVVSFEATDAGVEIGRLVVAPQYFRQGVGRMLLNGVEQYASPGGWLRVSTATRNVPAIRLYEQHGFRITQRRVLPDGLALVQFEKSMT